MIAAEPQTGFDQDIKVIVKNDNPEEVILKFDGQDYHFPNTRAVPISLEAAMFLFAVDGRSGKIVRDKQATSGYPNDEPFYKQCCLRYGCWNPDGIKWFDNFRFKVDRRTREISAEQFDKI